MKLIKTFKQTSLEIFSDILANKKKANKVFTIRLMIMLKITLHENSSERLIVMSMINVYFKKTRNSLLISGFTKEFTVTVMATKNVAKQ